jgi:DNA polymerase-3 subunit alpha (Gram-positive type)
VRKGVKMMIAPKGEWHEFSDQQEKISYLKQNKLLPKTKNDKPIYYSGFYTKERVVCEVVGYVDKNIVVINVNGENHCINIDCLLDMQKSKTDSSVEMTDLPLTEKSKVNYIRTVKHSPANFVVFDLETTGKDIRKDEIVEIGAVKYKNWKQVESFQSLVKPQKMISFFAQSVNHITNDMVEDARESAVVLRDFMYFCEGLPLIAFNGASFDFKLLEKSCDAAGITLKTNGYDAYQLAKKKIKGAPAYNLEALKDYFHLKFESHRALTDVLTTAEVWKRCFPEDFLLEDFEQAEDAKISSDVWNITERYYRQIVDVLENSEQNYDATKVAAKKIQTKSETYDAILFFDQTVFHIKGKSIKYIRFPKRIKSLFDDEGIEATESGEWYRIPVESFPGFEEHKDVVIGVYEKFLQASDPFGCCGSYAECSEAGKCIKPDIMFAGRCQYRQNLIKGKNFYGEMPTE